MYSEGEVRSAIALIKARKREQHIPNLAGYFTAAIKGGWSSTVAISQRSALRCANPDSNFVSQGEIFRLWYDLAKELGYCSSQEVREGEQWVYISGLWERWETAVKRGYSLEYLKGVMKRNQK